MVKEIWDFVISQAVIITVQFLPEKLNVRANWESKKIKKSSQWLLSFEMF